MILFLWGEVNKNIDRKINAITIITYFYIFQVRTSPTVHTNSTNETAKECVYSHKFIPILFAYLGNIA